MKPFCRVLCIALCCMSFTVTNAALPENYQSLMDEQKQAIIWENVSQSHQANPLPELDQGGFWSAYEKLKGLFSLAPSFDHVSDEMPQGRKKIIHSNGSVAKVYWQASSGHPFTGVYQSGAVGVARLSLATAPSDSSYIPGMALKLFISAKPSLNLHLMNALEGQGENWNFFAKDFTNKIAHPSSWLLKAIEKIFAWTKSPANELDVSHLAQWDRQGQAVELPVAPEQLYFKPVAPVSQIIDPASREDFRTSLLEIPLGAMYEIYGELQGTVYYIGSLKLESQLSASEYGDKTLFFQHQR